MEEEQVRIRLAEQSLEKELLNRKNLKDQTRRER